MLKLPHLPPKPKLPPFPRLPNLGIKPDRLRIKTPVVDLELKIGDEEKKKEKRGNH